MDQIFFCTVKCHVNLIPVTENIKMYSVSYNRAFCFMETLYSNTIPYQIHTPVFFLKIQKISLNLFKMRIPILKRYTIFSTYIINSH